MKTKIIAFALALSFLPAMMFGQEVSNLSPKHSPLRHNIGIEAGGPSSLYSTVMVLTEAMFVLPAYVISNRDLDIDLRGCYGISYHYQVNSWLQVGVKSYVELLQNSVYDTSRVNLQERTTFALVNIMPSVRFTYLNRPMVRLYSGIDLGMGIFASTPDKNSDGESAADKSSPCYFSFNITPIGVSVGKKFYGLFETNIGSSTFFKVGLGCRF